MKRFRNIPLSLASGYILMFYSEYLFYGQLNDPGSPLPTVSDLVLLYAVYSLMAYILMAFIRRYHIRTLSALLLVGAIYGWMLEGGIVATTYEALPWSLSFTGLAWHMPLDVLIGWYGMQRLLRTASRRRMLFAALGLGLFWGFWAVWTWYDGIQPPNPAAFFSFSLLSVGLLMLAYWVNGRIGLGTFQATRNGQIFAGVIWLGWYALNTAPIAPMSLWLLPLLLGVSWLALRKHRAAENATDALDALASPPRGSNLRTLVVFPITAAIIYGSLAAAGWKIPSSMLVFFIAAPLGFVLYGWAIWKSFRMNAPAAS